MTDRSTDPKRFDPRFDPAFQPGYDPRNDPAIAARATPQRPDAPQPPRPDAVNAVPDSVVSGPHRAIVPADDDEPASARVAEAGQQTDDGAPTRGNPFSIALWVVSVLLVAAGITIFRAIPGIDVQTADSGSTSTFVQLFGYAMVAAVLIGAGILVAVGNLFVLAVRWRGRSVDRAE